MPGHIRLVGRRYTPHLLRVRPKQVKEVHKQGPDMLWSYSMGTIRVHPTCTAMRLASAPRDGARFAAVWMDTPTNNVTAKWHSRYGDGPIT